jgi:hypothetical protein
MSGSGRRITSWVLRRWLMPHMRLLRRDSLQPQVFLLCHRALLLILRLLRRGDLLSHVRLLSCSGLLPSMLRCGSLLR